MDNKEIVITNLKQTISKGGDEKMIEQLKKRLVIVEKNKQVNK
jgi:hypothetical protein|tara:strand:+ start:1642 stop:1770 length:129 start_codon:yes stop_codon:yes gene_type:complete